MSNYNIVSDEYADLKTNVVALLQKYEEKLKELDPVGMGLSGRVLSCISLLRECDDRFFEKDDPDNYLEAMFNKQFDFIDMHKNLMNRLDIMGKLEQQQQVSDDLARDLLHKDLFDQTWQTLKMSSDPFNDYREYISLIEARMEKNNLDADFFKGKKCLDVGCGTGRFSFCMANLGAEVWGVDFGATSIDRAKQLAESFKMDNVHFSVGNAYDLKFEPETFDFVVCNGVLHHLDQPKTALSEIFRVTKKDGLFWLYIEGSGGIYHDVWNLICRSFNGVPVARVLEAVKFLKIPNMHFWMDIFFAKYNGVKWDDNVERLKRIGFTDVERMKGSHLIDLDIEMFSDDPFAKVKFGDGGLRMIIRK